MATFPSFCNAGVATGTHTQCALVKITPISGIISMWQLNEANSLAGLSDSSSYRGKECVTSTQKALICFFLVSHIGCIQEVYGKTLVSQRDIAGQPRENSSLIFSHFKRIWHKSDHIEGSCSSKKIIHNCMRSSGGNHCLWFLTKVSETYWKEKLSRNDQTILQHVHL